MEPDTIDANHDANKTYKNNPQHKTYTGKYKGACVHITGSQSNGNIMHPFLCIRYDCGCPRELTCIMCFAMSHSNIDYNDILLFQIQDRCSYITDSHRINLLTNINRYKPVFDKRIGDLEHEMYQMLQNNIVDEISNSSWPQEYIPIDAEYISNNISRFNDEFTPNIIEITRINGMGNQDKQKNIYICINNQNTINNDDPSCSTEIVTHIMNKSLVHYVLKNLFEKKQNEFNDICSLSHPINNYKRFSEKIYPEIRTGRGLRMKAENKRTTMARLVDFRYIFLDQLQLTPEINKKIGEALDIAINQYKLSIQDQDQHKNWIVKTLDKQKHMHVDAEGCLNKEMGNMKQKRVAATTENNKYIKNGKKKIKKRTKRRHATRKTYKIEYKKIN